MGFNNYYDIGIAGKALHTIYKYARKKQQRYETITNIITVIFSRKEQEERKNHAPPKRNAQISPFLYISLCLLLFLIMGEIIIVL